MAGAGGPRLSVNRSVRSFERAYQVAVTTSVLASVLTVLYVGSNTVPESNPVTAALIARTGLGTTVIARTVCVVAGYWGYYLVGVSTASTQLAVSFAWVGAAINTADAAGNLLAALLLGVVPVGGNYDLLGLCLVCGLLAVQFSPPDPVHRTQKTLLGRV